MRWLTPVRCRMILIAVIASTALGHLHYLHNDCPIDLAGDEAQYWDWSRRLDWSYYSKGPLVAYLIRGSTEIFGDTMPAVRYPAIVLWAGTTLVTFALTRRLFGSDRLALGAVLLIYLVPVVIPAGVIMTIDPPMLFFWALATYFVAIALFDNRRWPWPIVGLAIGLGFLAKYAAILWFIGLFGFLLLDRASRKHLRGALIALAIAGLLTLPVLMWNASHDWVSLRHVARQTGAAGGSFSRGNLAEFLASQFAVANPILVVLMIVAVVYVWRLRDNPNRRKLLLLVCIGGSFFAITMLASLFTKVQVNWPLPAYFTLIVLAAYYIGTRIKSRILWRPWRGWFWTGVAFGLLAIFIAHDSSRMFPVVRLTNIDPARVDLLARLRGWEELGDHVTRQLDDLGPGAFVLCDDYMQAAEVAFYVTGQPKTYYAGSYYSDARRFTQYDLWPDRRLDDPKLRGRNAVFVGKGGEVPADVVNAFGRLEQLPDLPVVVRGVTVKTFRTWRGYGFKGMKRTDEAGDY